MWEDFLLVCISYICLMKTLIIVGAGTAGLMAAFEAASQAKRAQKSLRVILLEKKRKVGLKLTITGKKRCNVTNTAELKDFIGNFGKNGKFLRQALGKYFNNDVIEFFESRGLETQSERQGRVFPKNGKATDVVDTLLQACLKSGVDLRISSPVEKIIAENEKIKAVIVDGREIATDYLLVTVGGASYTGTGSSGDGFKWAKELGIKVVDLRPGLVPLVVSDPNIKMLRGLDVKNIGLRILLKGKKKIEDFGEIGFNTTGMGGALILRHSGWVVDQLAYGKEVAIELDLKPSLSLEKLDNKLLALQNERAKESVENALRGILPQVWIDYLLKRLNIDGQKKMIELGKSEKILVRNTLKNLHFEISGHRSLNEGIVTQGGVHLSQVDPITFACKSIPNLYFAGEVLDLHAETGGYNIQAAFTGGTLAARDVVSKV
jgi:predicted Rossmann fold flavoprotein